MVYHAADEFSGLDELVFRVSDGQASSAVATVTIHVLEPTTEPAEPPEADVYEVVNTLVPQGLCGVSGVALLAASAFGLVRTRAGRPRQTHDATLARRDDNAAR
jgi:hypothetical protein